MQVFDKALNAALAATAFLGLKNGPAGSVAPDAGQGDESKRRERSRARKVERKKKQRIKREVIDQETDYLSDKQRDPPPERIETAHLRRLPDFVIIGAQRGGTTSLYQYLTAHPDVGPAFRKEVHYFERFHDKGLDWYLSHFPVRGEVPIVGEASPNYLIHPDAPERALGVVPHARLIALLRNPVDRAYSHYQMKVKRGIEPLSFEDALDKERERLSGSDDPASPAWRHYSYVERGLYVDQLQRWMAVFPREQFMIIKSEDLYEDPERVLGQTQAYLGLRPWSPDSFRAYNTKEYVAIDPATRERLAAHFEPYNRRLYALLGRDLGWENE